MKRVCENSVQMVTLGLAESGDLCVLRDGEWQEVAFNDLYVGIYPPCVFQDILYAREDFYAAATKGDGSAAVFTSLRGDIWTPLNLKEEHFWSDDRQAKGGAVRLLFEPRLSQILLVCSSGDVVILPECPKCAQILHVTDKTVTDAEYQDHRLTLIYEDGQTEVVSLAAADQIRVSMSYARQACEERGGEIIDVRPAHMKLFEGSIPCTAAVDPEDLDAYLEDKAHDTGLYFICSYGRVADQAAWHAYEEGFQNARSLGGHHEGLHID